MVIFCHHKKRRHTKIYEKIDNQNLRYPHSARVSLASSLSGVNIIVSYDCSGKHISLKNKQESGTKALLI